MKRIWICLFLTLVASSMAAQISFTLITEHVKCNHSEFGSAEVNVSPTDPPYSFAWSNGGMSSSIQNLSEGTYTLTITDDSGDDTVVTVDIKYLECEMKPEMVMTPNDDGINDSWLITNSEFFPQAQILVFNRLGQKVYEHNGIYKPWDGRDLFGMKVPDASYYYVIYHNGKDEGSIIKGSISILK